MDQKILSLYCDKNKILTKTDNNTLLDIYNINENDIIKIYGNIAQDYKTSIKLSEEEIIDSYCVC
jgi:hypothetical protein